MFNEADCMPQHWVAHTYNSQRGSISVILIMLNSVVREQSPYRSYAPQVHAKFTFPVNCPLKARHSSNDRESVKASIPDSQEDPERVFRSIWAAAQHLLSVKLQSQILVSEATFMSPWLEEQTNIPNGTGG